MRCPRGAWPLLLVPVLWLAGPSPAEARQAAGGLDRAERFVSEGRFAQARDLVERWWNERGEAPARGELQKAIWLRALLTEEPGLAELDYRRLVVEFPGGSHSDEALLRLARGAEARGDPGAARRHLTILVRDYPGSPHRLEARSLLERLPEDPPDRAVEDLRAEAPEPPPDAADPELVAEAPPDPRLVDAEGALPLLDIDDPLDDPVVEDPVEMAEGVENIEDVESAPFTIQLGAFSTVARARALAARAQEAGLEVRVIRVGGSELVRVRIGAFPTREAAQEHARDILARGFEAVVSSDREREEAIP